MVAGLVGHVSGADVYKFQEPNSKSQTNSNIPMAKGENSRGW